MEVKVAKKSHPPWLGGAAAMMSVCITHPIDQTKVRTQTQAVRQGMLATAAQTIRDSPAGVRGLWVGLSGSLLRQATYGATRFGVYNWLKSRDGVNADSVVTMVTNGAIAGVAAGMVGGPAELVMVRMCSDGLKPPQNRLNYRNAIDGLIQIKRTEGWPRMFRGMEATVLRSVVMNATQLSAYDIIKKRLLSTGRFRDNVPLHLLTATLGGTIAVVACAPIDVFKSRIQSSTSGASSISIITSTLRQEGPRVLFRGLIPAWCRMTPTTALTFVFFEQLKKVF